MLSRMVSQRTESVQVWVTSENSTSCGSTGRGFPSGTGSVRYLSFPVSGLISMPLASEYALSPFSTPAEEPPASSAAASTFSRAVMPPSAPPGRASSPPGVGDGARASVSWGVSDGTGLPLTVGGGLSASPPGVTIGAMDSSGPEAGGAASSTALLSCSCTVQP